MATESLINAVADLVGYCAPMVCIFGFVRYALGLIYDVWNGGKLK